MSNGTSPSLWKAVLEGQEKLRHVFWLYFVVSGIGGYLVVSMLNGVVMAVVPYGVILAGLLYAIAVLYLAWCLFAIWQCAFNVQWKPWGYLARIFSVWAAIQLVYLAWVSGAVLYVINRA